MNRRSLLVSRRSFLSASSLLVAPAVARADVIRAGFPMHEPELVRKWWASRMRNLARVQRAGGPPAGAGESVVRLGVWRLGNVYRRGIPRRQSRDCRVPDRQRRAPDDFHRGDARAARRRQGAHRAVAGHPTDAGTAQHHAAEACHGRRATGSGGRRLPQDDRRRRRAAHRKAADAGRRQEAVRRVPFGLTPIQPDRDDRQCDTTRCSSGVRAASRAG